MGAFTPQPRWTVLPNILSKNGAVFPNKEVDGTGKQYFLKGLVPVPSEPHSPLMFGLEAHDLRYVGAFRGKHQRARQLSYSICQRAKSAWQICLVCWEDTGRSCSRLNRPCWRQTKTPSEMEPWIYVGLMTQIRGPRGFQQKRREKGSWLHKVLLRRKKRESEK